MLELNIKCNFMPMNWKKAIAEKVINEVQVAYDNDIVTEIMPFEVFYEAEEKPSRLL